MKLSWTRGPSDCRKEKSSGTRVATAVLQSQRDCVFQPRVARNELPWVAAEGIFNPNGVASNFRLQAATPVGVVCLLPRFPRIARSSQPWALCRNPFGNPLWNFRKALPQARIVGATPPTVSAHLRPPARALDCLPHPVCRSSRIQSRGFLISTPLVAGKAMSFAY